MFVFTIVGLGVTLGIMLIGLWVTASITLPPLAHALHGIASQAYHNWKEGPEPDGRIGMDRQPYALHLESDA